MRQREANDIAGRAGVQGEQPYIDRVLVRRLLCRGRCFWLSARTRTPHETLSVTSLPIMRSTADLFPGLASAVPPREPLFFMDAGRDLHPARTLAPIIRVGVRASTSARGCRISFVPAFTLPPPRPVFGGHASTTLLRFALRYLGVNRAGAPMLFRIL
jgi:hypothetical protein